MTWWWRILKTLRFAVNESGEFLVDQTGRRLRLH
jgi:hypothetical protein